jgi:hypothetical protein
MTLSEAKALVREAKRLMREARDMINGRDSRHVDVELWLSRADYDTMEWGVGHLPKAWIWDLDDEGERIPGTAELIRVGAGGMFTKPDGTENFMFKGIPVRCAEPVGARA